MHLHWLRKKGDSTSNRLLLFNTISRCILISVCVGWIHLVTASSIGVFLLLVLDKSEAFLTVLRNVRSRWSRWWASTAVRIVGFLLLYLGADPCLFVLSRRLNDGPTGSIQGCFAIPVSDLEWDQPFWPSDLQLVWTDALGSTMSTVSDVESWMASQNRWQYKQDETMERWRCQSVATKSNEVGFGVLGGSWLLFHFDWMWPQHLIDYDCDIRVTRLGA